MREQIDQLVSTLFPTGIYTGFEPQPITDKRGFFKDAEVFTALLEEVRPTTLIEVGSWKGHSAVHMALQAKKLGLETKIICVDTWLGSQEHWTNAGFRQLMSWEFGRPTIYRDFLSNVVLNKCQDRIIPITLPSVTAATVLRKFGVKADLIYIDGAHEYEDVRNDVRLFHPLLERGGVLFGDDYPYDPLRKAVDEFATANGFTVIPCGSRKWRYATS